MWEGRSNSSTIIEHPLAAIGKELKYEEPIARGFNWEFAVEPQFIVGYVAQVLAWTRLIMLEEPHGFNGRAYWAEKILLFDALTEDWVAETIVGFRGQSLFDALATRCDADPASEQYQLAYKTVWRLLTQSSMQKITHGKNLTKTEALGVLWDKEENAGKDCEPGTFAEVLRFGSVHLEQTRERIDYVEAKISERVIQKGLLEP